MTKKSSDFLNISPTLFETLGLTASEAAVYIAALQLGQANMQELSKMSHVKRTSIYNFIERLKERGIIIEVVKKKRKLYSALQPNQLMALERTRLQKLEQVIPTLEQIQRQVENKPKVTFFEGIDQVLTVYDDQLAEQKPIIAYEDLEYMKSSMSHSFFDTWADRRAAKDITFKSILRDSEVARNYTKKNIKWLRESKLIETEPWKTEINIYGDKVAMMRFGEKNAMCVLIEDQDIAETMRSNWNLLWNNLDVPIVG